MRMVIENGNQFKKENFFMMLGVLTSTHLEVYADRFIKIMTEEL